MKKWTLLASIMLAALAPASLGVVVGDFEGGLDGWHGGDATLSVSDIGVTSGSNSMLLEGPGNWHLNALVDARPWRTLLGTEGVYLTADITVFADDITSNWMNVEMVVNAQNNDDNGANNNVGWNTLGQQAAALDGLTYTYTWTLPEALTTKIAGTDETIGWFELGLISNLDGASVTKYYVDNVQIVPEPATLALLAVGGLAVLRRRGG